MEHTALYLANSGPHHALEHAFAGRRNDNLGLLALDHFKGLAAQRGLRQSIFASDCWIARVHFATSATMNVRNSWGVELTASTPSVLICCR